MSETELVNFLATSSLIVALCSLGNSLIWFVGIFATAAPSKMSRVERGLVCAIQSISYLSLFFTRGVDGLLQGVVRFVTEGGGGPLLIVFEAWRIVYIIASIAFWIWVVHILNRDYKAG